MNKILKQIINSLTEVIIQKKNEILDFHNSTLQKLHSQMKKTKEMLIRFASFNFQSVVTKILEFCNPNQAQNKLIDLLKDLNNRVSTEGLSNYHKEIYHSAILKKRSIKIEDYVPSIVLEEELIINNSRAFFIRAVASSVHFIPSMNTATPGSEVLSSDRRGHPKSQRSKSDSETPEATNRTEHNQLCLLEIKYGKQTKREIVVPYSKFEEINSDVNLSSFLTTSNKYVFTKLNDHEGMRDYLLKRLSPADLSMSKFNLVLTIGSAKEINLLKTKKPVIRSSKIKHIGRVYSSGGLSEGVLSSRRSVKERYTPTGAKTHRKLGINLSEFKG